MIMIMIMIMIMTMMTTPMMKTTPTTPSPSPTLPPMTTTTNTTMMTMMMLMVYEMPSTKPETSLAPQWLRSSEDRNDVDEILRSEMTCMAMFRTWIILGLEADNTLKSIFQIRWQAIAQTNVNIIILWWTVTYNGITWQWRKITLYDAYIQIEHGYWMPPVGVSLAY